MDKGKVQELCEIKNDPPALAGVADCGALWEKRDRKRTQETTTERKRTEAEEDITTCILRIDKER